MPSFLCDTSILVAAFCGWHERHRESAAEIETRLDQEDDMVVATHTLAELYSVLTRLPAPHRLSPRDALDLLEANLRACRAVALNERDYWKVLERGPGSGLTGGIVYDALIAQAASKAIVAEILTLNPRHFRRLELEGVEVTEPPAPRDGRTLS
ncbi:MAG: PIN domain-containing protein [Armatimonadetes bacterium]|nr:PIN domain-containing protein [Armatimonadota bacterium]